MKTGDLRCLAKARYLRNPIATGRGFATPAMQRLYRLAAFDSAEVRFVASLAAASLQGATRLDPSSRHSIIRGG